MSIDQMTERPSDTEAPSNYALENREGRDCADEVIVSMMATGNPTLLGKAVREMTDAERPIGYSVGFYHRLADQIIGG